MLSKGMNLFLNVHQLLIAAGKILETINMPVPVAPKNIASLIHCDTLAFFEAFPSY